MTKWNPGTVLVPCVVFGMLAAGRAASGDAAGAGRDALLALLFLAAWGGLEALRER